MKTSAQYQHMVAEIHLDEIKSEGISPAEAGEFLSKLETAHNQLLEVERSLNLDLRAFNAQYQGRMASSLRDITSHHGKNRVEEEQRIQDERESKLAPYEDIKKQIAQMLSQVDELRAKLEKAKASPAKA
jgi:hypothetical protein